VCFFFYNLTMNILQKFQYDSVCISTDSTAKCNCWTLSISPTATYFRLSVIIQLLTVNFPNKVKKLTLLQHHQQLLLTTTTTNNNNNNNNHHHQCFSNPLLFHSPQHADLCKTHTDTHTHTHTHLQWCAHCSGGVTGENV
jgi:hypothetical protein